MTESTNNTREHLMSKLAVMLVRPAYAGNVGAVARVMANFDCKQGLLVSPRCDVSSLEARKYATGPSAVTLATFQAVRSIAEETRDFHGVIAITRRTGGLRKQTIEIQDIAARLLQGKIALVFGPEESGLSDDDVKACTHVLSLDVSEKMASLNLSHAVAIVLSKIFSDLHPVKNNYEQNASESKHITAVNAADYDSLQSRLLNALLALEVSGDITNAERLSRILIQPLMRGNLDSSEISAWHGIISLLNKPK